MSVTAEIAVVYRGGGRRWLSLEAACRAEAKKAVRARAWAADMVTTDEQGRDRLSIPQDWYVRMVRTLAHFHKSAFRRRAVKA
ncbi:MAG: hypothetical protein J7521_20160 [Caulobacter sp.]|nr:hypothetical protein [Caulobacter sp.]